MSDLDKVLAEAQQAREEAEAASRRAAELEAQAEETREQANRQAEERRRAWAQQTVDRYEAELTKADAAIQAAQERFETVAVEDLAGAVEAYLAWGDAAIRHHVVQVRAGIAAPALGMEATASEFAAPPPFSQALDQALTKRLVSLSDRARDEAQAEIGRAVAGEMRTTDATRAF